MGRVTLNVCEDGLQMCRDNNLTGVSYVVWPASKFRQFGFHAHYVGRILSGIVNTIRYSKPSDPRRTIIYSSSDFWPDLIPSLIMKLRFRGAKWVAGYYLSVTLDLVYRRFDPTSRLRLPRFEHVVYYLTQKIARIIIRRYSDAVFVTSEPDRPRFISGRLPPSKVVAVRGGVDIDTPALIPEPMEKKYDAVFLGRFHPQKGVLYLIDIWKLVCDKRPARLAMIGAGVEGTYPQYEIEVRNRISELGLEDKIEIFGFLDGPEKIRIFKSSKMFLYPSTYGSGGMATGEAMACGLPAVSFDLEHLKTYYPKGLVKAPLKDLNAFANNILRLLDDKEFYSKKRNEAIELSLEWDWKKRAAEVYSFLDCL